MKKRTLIALLVLALVLAWPHLVLAHPHIFVRYNVSIAPAGTGFVTLHFAFKINAPPNPLLTPGAQAADNPQLQRDMLANLAAHPFYIYLDMDGENLGRQEVRPVLSDGESYVFDLSLPAARGNFGFSLYDPGYFVAVNQDGADAVKTGLKKTACTVNEEKVGKTIWGIIRAQHVECGSKGSPKFSNPRLEKMPSEDNAATNHGVSGGRNLLP